MRKHKSSIPYYEQSENSECGLCSLAMIFSYYYCEYTINELRESYAVGRDGLNLLLIKNIAESKGFATQAFRINSAEDILFPAVLNVNKAHFIVAERKTKNGLLIVDPARGKYEITDGDIHRLNITLGVQIVGTEQSEERKSKSEFRLLKHIKSGASLIAISVLFTIVLQGITLAVPILISKMIDNISSIENLLRWEILLPGFLGVMLVYFVLSIGKEKLLVRLQVKINKEISQQFVWKLLSLPIRFFANRGSGDIVHRYTGAVVVREIISSKIIAIWLDFGLIIIYSIYMLSISPKFFGIIMLFALVMGGFSFVSVRKSRELLTKEVVEEASATAFFNEMVRGINIVKMKGNEEYIYEDWNNHFLRQMKCMENKGNFMAAMNSVISSIQFITPLILFGIAVQDVLQDSLTIGVAFSIFIVGQGFFAPVNSIVNVISESLYALSYYRRIAEIHDLKSEENLTEGIEELKIQGNIDVKDLCFQYNMQGEMVLKNISLTIRKGEFIGIVGETASGKSTLATVLMGLEKATKGCVFYDGVPIEDINKHTLRHQIGMVSQSSYFFKKSILENLVFGNPNVSIEEIVLACKRAAIWDEINAMPMKLETILSEDADNISGGQRQRLALARAIINQPNVLYIDEGTSALDNLTERAVQESLKNMKCTRIVIAHRLGTIIDADKIIVMREGEIQGAGSHEELMKTNSYYKKLYNQKLLEEKQNHTA